MATIKYDGLEDPENLVTFTEIPNILTVSEPIDGEKANVTIDVVGDLEQSTSADTQWYITFFGETITNVIDPKNANGKRFYASQDTHSTAVSIARALRSCPKISTAFEISVDNVEVHLVAKTIGKKWNVLSDVLFTNLPSEIVEISYTSEGSSESDLFDSKIVVDIYTQENYSGTFDKYVTSFEKNMLTGSTSFNMSPLLASISEHGQSTPYAMNVSAIKANGYVEELDSISGNSIVGFSTNDNSRYLFGDSIKVLANNAGALYTFENEISLSVLQADGYWTETIKMYNSLGAEIYNYSYPTYKNGENLVRDKTISLNSEKFAQAAYVTLKIANNTEIRYDILRPLKMSEGNTRIYWRNCYGGVSFFDFTSTKSDSTEIEIESYEKNIFDFYQTQNREKTKIYSNNFSKTFKLTSHLFKEDGKWIFDDLMKSKKIWLKGANNTIVYIIPKSIEVEENTTYNGLFTAKFTYQLSYQ